MALGHGNVPLPMKRTQNIGPGVLVGYPERFRKQLEEEERRASVEEP